MSKFLRILQIIIAAIAAVLAMAFLFIEGYGIFSGNWILHEQPFLGLLQYLLRFAIAAGPLLTSVTILHGKKPALYRSICTAVSCVVLAPLIPNGLGVLFLILAAAVLLTCVVRT